MKFYLETYGCAANRAHGEVMKGLLLRSGCEMTERIEAADVLILNSCIVKSATENRILHRLEEWQNEYPDKKIIVAGCMPQAEYGRTKEFAPDASLVGPHNCEDITKAVRKISEGKQVEFLDERREAKLCLPRVRDNKYVDICEVAQGCLGDCSYCQVKFAKGNLKSYEPNQILKEIRQSRNNGCKEIWITAQDTAAYGRDIGTNLPELLEQIINLPGRFRVRAGMMNVDTIRPILDELIDVYKSDKIYSFLHLPLQSGSDRILKKMRRKYSVEEWKEVASRFREEIPDLNLWTDVIVGFPGETKEEYEKTKELLEDVRPDYFNVSRFTARPGTDAKEMDQLTTEVKKKRSEELSEMVRRISHESKKSFVGREREILVTEKTNRGNQYKGRDESYRPVIVSAGKEARGDFFKVEMTDAQTAFLEGSFI
ncbi:MAG: tRNA (N(6)-L-threonylcarbamoyladenosine(37)-C(2))-methylthiotransferase [Candidatus Aenigmatarchaeota archaeon]